MLEEEAEGRKGNAEMINCISVAQCDLERSRRGPTLRYKRILCVRGWQRAVYRVVFLRSSLGMRKELGTRSPRTL